ncbi:hypothetical protein [Synechococcus sp. BA-132 BA5]|uniref:hypothetical protein n=1 Tax=Synechococcus sp. BA-132 BA5 TaxID=3110252 RepID=UPI002B2182AD|nr:hypothetical protein [Synechococcus sp. BA-132 BA5]MEA5415198.1 hypothetical protein [Synechococcus sp. BA-132 BA5]
MALPSRSRFRAKVASRQSRCAWLAVALLTLAPLAALEPPPAQAQSELRKSFPGRRVGGGTRGDCSSRLLAHLVPSSSVFAPGKARFLGVLEGPSASPSPLEITFRPLSGRGTADGSMASGQRRVLPASAPGITLLTLPAVKVPTMWESSYLCPGSAASSTSADPLNFVAADSPPALSLLVTEPSKEDAAVQASLAKLHRSCGSSVSRDEVGAAFGLADLITAQWPERLPVRCPA